VSRQVSSFQKTLIDVLKQAICYLWVDIFQQSLLSHLCFQNIFFLDKIKLSHWLLFGDKKMGLSVKTIPIFQKGAEIDVKTGSLISVDGTSYNSLFTFI
jgi:hypothetical protein